MGIGPVPAIEALLKTSNNTQQDIDLFDVRHCSVSVLFKVGL